MARACQPPPSAPGYPFGPDGGRKRAAGVNWRQCVFAVPFLFLGGTFDAAACQCISLDPAQALGAAQVIVDGVVIARPNVDPAPDPFIEKTARMRIDVTWKGEASGIVDLLYSEDGAACGKAPPVGQTIRVATLWVAESQLGYGLCSELPLDDSNLNRLLSEYKHRTDAMLQQSASAGEAGKKQLAAYFRENGELRRSLRILKGLLEVNPADLDALLGAAVLHAQVDGFAKAKELIAAAKAVAADTPENRGRFARAEFEALGTFDTSWKNWSGVRNAWFCDGRAKALGGADFRDAHLKGCDFAGADLRNANFAGADLSLSDISEADVTGAAFDCGTRFWPGFDPLSKGMIKVDGTCETEDADAN